MQPVVTFTSSVAEPYPRGHELGTRFTAEIGRTVAAYRRLFAARAAVADGGPVTFDVDAWARRAWDRISRVEDEVSEEVRGIAEGSGVPVTEIAALNARTELLAVIGPPAGTECSTVVALPQDAGPVAVQTWDWYDAMAGNWLRWTIPHPDGTVVHTVTEFGVLGKIGVSSRGVGVLFNMLHHRNDGTDGTDELGYPLHLLSRRILDSAHDLDEALELAGKAAVSASSSLTVVDGSRRPGRAASIEMFPLDGPGVVEPEDGLLVRTNHFVSDAGRGGCLADAGGPGSRIRRDTLLTAFAGRRPASPADVVTAMHDHAEVGGVCAHPDSGMDRVLQHGTLATVSLDVSAGALDVTRGGPCRTGS